MNRSLRCVSLCLVFVSLAVIASCTGTSKVTLSFPSGTAAAIDLGQSYTINVTSTNDSGLGVSWSCTGTACSATALTNVTITSVTFNANGVTGTATITATSNKDTTMTATVTITVNALPSITTTQGQLTAATGGVAYSFTFTTTGGSGTLTWTATGLPAGLSLSSGGVLSGTATVTGTFTINVTIKDSSAAGAQSQTLSFTLTVNKPAPPAITTTQSQVSAATVGTAYAFTFQATGTGTLTWSAGTTLPADGLSLNTATGVVSGTPTSPQVFGITLTVSDTFGQSSPATGFTITVKPAPLAITTTTLPQGTIGTAYSQSVAVTGGTTPYTWSVSAGSLPSGLSLNASTGAITGTPTPTAVTSSFTIEVTDSSSPQMSAPQNLSIAIKLVITTTSLPNGAIGTAYNQTLVAEGGTPTYTWSVSSGSLPAGLALNTSTGAITGTPANNATSQTFTVQVQDSTSPTKQSATQNLSISIPLTIETTSLPNGAIGTAYSQTVAVGGGTTPYTFAVSAGTLPDGLSLNSSTGAITGTPKPDAQTESFTITVTDTSSPATQNLSIFIPLLIETTSLPSGTVSVAYNQSVAVGGGTQPYTWSTNSANLPPGLTLSATTGAITGTPTTTGTFSFTVNVVDSSTPTQQSAGQALSITISTVTVTSTQPTNATIGSSYSFTENVSGGTPPYTYTLASGTLPDGLSMTSSNSTGVITISGTPKSDAIDESFSIKVTDSSTPALTATSSTLTLVVSLVVTTTSPLPSGTVGTAYSTTIAAEGGQPPYTFAVDPSGSALPSGLSLNSSTGAITGTPATAATTNNIIIDVTDSATPVQTDKPAYSITISAAVAACGEGSEGLLSGQYTAVLQGHDSSGPVGIGLMFDADGKGGVATGGVGIEDINSTSASGVQQNLSIDSTKSSYSVGSDQRGCLTVVTGTTNQTFRFSLGSITSGVASNGHIIEFDSTTNSPVEFTAGVLRKQDTTAFNSGSFSGFSFAFGASAPEVGGGKFGVAGVFSTSGTTITTGSIDVNDAGTLDGDSSLTNFTSTSAFSITGSYTIGSNGRGTFTFSNLSPAVNGILYVVSASELLSLRSDAQTTNTRLFAGKVFQQSKSSFSASDVSGTYVAYSSALAKSVSGGTRTTLLLVTTTSTSTFNGTLDQNDGGTLSSASGSGTYSVASNGRGLLSISGSNHNSVLYLVSPTELFSLDASDLVGTGFAELQSGSPFTAASAKSPPSYAFGTIQPEVSAVSLDSGVVNFDGVSAITGTDDDNSSGTLSPGESISNTYSIDSTGTGYIPQSGKTCATTTDFTNGNCNLLFMVISPPSSTSPFGKVVLMDATPISGTSNETPSLKVAEQ